MTITRLRAASGEGNLAIAREVYLAALTRLAPVEVQRCELARLAERAIDTLDAIGGGGDSDFKPDNEDRCEAADDGTAPFVFYRHVCWGSLADAESSPHLPKPRHGIDQTHPLVGQ